MLEIVIYDVGESGAGETDIAALAFAKPEGPAVGGSPPNTTSSRDARGTKRSIPKEDAPNHEHG